MASVGPDSPDPKIEIGDTWVANDSTYIFIYDKYVDGKLGVLTQNGKIPMTPWRPEVIQSNYTPMWYIKCFATGDPCNEKSIQKMDVVRVHGGHHVYREFGKTWDTNVIEFVGKDKVSTGAGIKEIKDVEFVMRYEIEIGQNYLKDGIPYIVREQLAGPDGQPDDNWVLEKNDASSVFYEDGAVEHKAHMIRHMYELPDESIANNHLRNKRISQKFREGYTWKQRNNPAATVELRGDYNDVDGHVVVYKENRLMYIPKEFFLRAYRSAGRTAVIKREGWKTNFKF